MMITRLFRSSALAAGAVLAACASGTSPATEAPTPVPTAHGTPSSPTPTATPSAGVGLLVMAHGGDDAWNASVEAEVSEVRQAVPVELAFGMANPMTLRTALNALDAQGVRRVAVIRLFLSGDSFRDQTDWFLGMSDSPPSDFLLMGPMQADPAARLQIEHAFEVVTHDHGLLDTQLAEDILVERAASLSEDPAEESVLLIAHGMGDDRENGAVLDDLERIASTMRAAGYASVRAETLREDWPEKRAVAEDRIRDFVEAETSQGRRVLVVPARLSGFGPYAEVLEGLEYVPSQALLPHPSLSDWILRSSADLTCRYGWVVSEACGG
ncbi:MAG TPA: CbiX/SirB N-terminal domain-containing protein [Longimicrobiales bacterium]|nr:CbiX/SirB N-terminal domain-containing protein [Longimicrobiales bacterium]